MSTSTHHSSKNRISTLLTALVIGGLSSVATAAPANPVGACCYEDTEIGALVCGEMQASVCDSMGGYFYGAGTLCSDDVVECTPAGEAAACCVEDADLGWYCIDASLAECQQHGGVWYGFGVHCGDPGVNCLPLDDTGACCIDDPDLGWYCDTLTQADCLDVGGYFYGAGTICSDPFVECDPLSGACCYEDPNLGWMCIEVEHYKCNDIGGTWYAGLMCSDPAVDCDPIGETGACCVEEEPGAGYWYCIETTEVDCIDHAGVWYGLGSHCTDPGVNCDPIDDCHDVSGSDCAGRPRYNKQDYLGFGPGRVAVQTVSPGIPGDRMLTVFDLTGIGAQPFNTAFPIGRYNHPSWTAANLGSIMGLAIDEAGNIYVTASQTWNIDVMGPSGWGAVYRIDTNTAAISTFAVLPTANSSLGSITFDCEHDQFFVSSFEDGLIYRLDYFTGATLDTFDHGTPWSGSPGPAALGDRPFGLEVNGERLYYGLWNEDMSNVSSDNNEIWSVKLDAGGAPVPGAEELEITLTDHYVDGNYAFSSPVADIDFSDEGTLVLGERTQSGINNMGAHQARVLEYECSVDGWVLTSHNFDVGIPQSAAGGVDAKPNRVWASGDALHLGAGDNIYGFQGLPATGGSILDSWLIDYNDNLTIQDKTLLGDLVVTRVSDAPAPVADCPVIQVLDVECGTWFAPFEFDLHLGVSNMDASHTVTSVTMTPPSGIALTPDHVSMALPPLHSWPFDSVLTGAAQGSTVCIDFEVTFSNGAVCTETICIDLPICIIVLPGDFDLDGLVTVDDLMFMIGLWGEVCDGLDNDCNAADADGSGVVDLGDLLIVLDNWS